MIEPILRGAKKGVTRALATAPIRRALTRNYQCGRLAIGERNTYRVFPGWITADIRDADFNANLLDCQPFPFPDASFDCIYSCHAIEHISPSALDNFIRESFRILRDGGILRVEAPDADLVYEKYGAKDSAFFRSFANGGHPLWEQEHLAFVGTLACYMENGMHVPPVVDEQTVQEKFENLSRTDFYDWCLSLLTEEQKNSHGHINPIRYETLLPAMKAAGFSVVSRKQNAQSEIPRRYLSFVERPHRAYYSLYVEARKGL